MGAFPKVVVNTKVSIVAIVSLVVGLGWAVQAFATLYAGSRLSLRELQIDVTNPASLTVNTSQLSVQSAAALNGLLLADGAHCTASGTDHTCGIGPRLGPVTISAPSSVRVREPQDYKFFKPLFTAIIPGSNAFMHRSPVIIHPFKTVVDYSNTNAEIATASMVADEYTSTRQISEAALNTGQSGAADNGIEMLSGISVTSGTGAVVVSFRAASDRRVYMTSDEPGGFSGVSVTTTIQLAQRSGNGFVTWSPNGLLDQNCLTYGLEGLTCREQADRDNLNHEIAVYVPGTAIGGSLNYPGFVNFRIEIIGLAEGDWTLTLSSTTEVKIYRQSPPLRPPPRFGDFRCRFKHCP